MVDHELKVRESNFSLNTVSPASGVDSAFHHAKTTTNYHDKLRHGASDAKAVVAELKQKLGGINLESDMADAERLARMAKHAQIGFLNTQENFAPSK